LEHPHHKEVVLLADSSTQREVFDLARENENRPKNTPEEWIKMFLPGKYQRTHASLIKILAQRQLMKLSRMVRGQFFMNITNLTKRTQHHLHHFSWVFDRNSHWALPSSGALRRVSSMELCTTA